MGGARRAVFVSLVVNVLIALAKLAVSLVTGSAAMLAEGLHSFADTANQILLLVGLRLSRRPADENHPFGHGKERFFWSFVVALLIFALGGAFSVFEGVKHLLHPEVISEAIWNLVVLAFAFLAEGYSLRVAVHELKRSEAGTRSLWAMLRRAKDPEILTSFFENGAAVAGVVLAGLGVTLTAWTGQPLWDSLASVLIGLLLGGVAWWLAYETKGLLIGESARLEDRRALRLAVGRVPEVQKVLDVLTMHVGPENILVNMNVEFRDDLTTDQLERAIDDVERAIREAVPEAGQIFVEAEAATKRQSPHPNH